MTSLELSFAEMMAEIREIVRELESDQLDVDAVVKHVERANHLVVICSERIDAAQTAIEEIRPPFD